MSRVKILNIYLDNISRSELLREIKKGGTVLTPNIDRLVKLQRDRDFHKLYQLAEYVVCDSQILLYASYFLGTKITEKISGSDFFPQFYNYYKTDEDIKIFLLGGDDKAAEIAQDEINRKAGRKIVVDVYSPTFGFEKDPIECQQIIDRINRSGATVLAVGLGAPKQEKWIFKYKQHLPQVKIFLAIGATINFEAGIVRRAPYWMSLVGLEWLYRLRSEPKRLWRRYLLESWLFIWLIVKQKIIGNFNQRASKLMRSSNKFR